MTSFYANDDRVTDVSVDGSTATASLHHQHIRVESVELAVISPLPASSATLPPTTEGDDFEAGTGVNLASLAPVDGGFGAWSFLFGAFMVEFAVWGFPAAFGVFLEAYLRDTDLLSQPHASSLLPLVGNLSSGIMYCSGPVTYPLAARYRHLRRPVMWIGMVICWASLFAASFATTVTRLLALQGVLYAVGGAFMYAPAMSFFSEWFVRRRGLANGVIDAGTAAGGLLLPLVLPKSIRHHGTALTLRYLSFGFAIVMIFTLPLIKPRLPERDVRGPAPRVNNRTWLMSRQWWLVIIVNTIQGFAYFVPIVWLPTFASELNISPSTASLSVALLNGAGLVSRLTLGTLSDYFSPWLLALSTLAATSLVTFLLWGFAGHVVAGVLVYGMLYGMLAGGFSSLWTAFVRPVAKDDLSLYVTLFGYLMFSRGLGNVLSTPISTSLSTVRDNVKSSPGTGFAVAGGRFEQMIVYVGSCFAGAAVIALVAWVPEIVAKRRLTRV
ncbi:major facilitator superfamily domain-containing protein [Amylostereum chailletii]|nr:major facilitator superfamily domain-containing protein [Amylostereum chailletii]